jgi:hypothetical protein
MVGVQTSEVRAVRLSTLKYGTRHDPVTMGFSPTYHFHAPPSKKEVKGTQVVCALD